MITKANSNNELKAAHITYLSFDISQWICIGSVLGYLH